MNSLEDIWNEILRLLALKLTPTAIDTWFAGCEPVALEEKRLVLRTESDYKKLMIESRFSNFITDALSALFSTEFGLLILSADEPYPPEDSRDMSDPTLSEMAAYTFDNFIVGSSNKFAHAAAIAVAEDPGKAYNPLFIYGNSGLGKTHLLWAIAHAIHDRFPEKKISYVKGYDFMNQMVRSIQEGKIVDFREEQKKVDLFLVDDIQFISGKQSTQVEFFHTFNSIYEAGKQIVITSDRPPKEMSLLDDRLRTRFEGGLMASIDPPDLETRMAIARNKAARLGLILSDEVIEYIAEKITPNVRQLEGVIKKLTAYRNIMNTEINRDTVDRAINDVIQSGSEIPKPDRIIAETAKYYSLRPEDLKGNNRSKNTAMARQVAMYLIRQLTNLSLNDIGNELGRTHSTTLMSIRKIEDQMRTDPDLSGIIRDITSNITTDG